MDLTDIEPAAWIGAVAGLIIGAIILKGMSFNALGDDVVQLGLIWKILLPIVTTVAGFFTMQFMASR